MGDFTITKELEKAFKDKKIEYIPIRVATPEEFYKAIENAKRVNTHGAFVTKHSLDEYKNMKLYITLDGCAGIAITPDKNIVSIFNGGERKGVLKTYCILDT